mmetsp:Transcript_29199/g.79019  ORF Transcript_29199/g.79019 Transcript_29199/m.79019 type:complete len:206 (+) Transcript_29199:1225-1842(+)
MGEIVFFDHAQELGTIAPGFVHLIPKGLAIVAHLPKAFVEVCGITVVVVVGRVVHFQALSSPVFSSTPALEMVLGSSPGSSALSVLLGTIFLLRRAVAWSFPAGLLRIVGGFIGRAGPTMGWSVAVGTIASASASAPTSTSTIVSSSAPSTLCPFSSSDVSPAPSTGAVGHRIVAPSSGSFAHCSRCEIGAAPVFSNLVMPRRRG